MNPSFDYSVTTFIMISALYGSLFKDNTEAAFATRGLSASAGFLMTYAYQNSLKTAHKLYVCLAFLVVGIIGYTIVEIMEYWKNRTSSCSNTSIPEKS